MRVRRDKPADFYPSNPWPLLVVLAALGVGAGYAAFGHWKRSAVMIAGALVLAAVLRLVLPSHIAGLLVLRRRWIDVTLFAVLGLAIAAVSLAVPPST